jgi:hypothetical protein
MNERIKELSAIAKNLTTDDAIHLSRIHNRTLSLDELGEIFEQKFAELIVTEMCGMMEQTEDDLYAMDPSERPTEYIEWLYYWRTRFEKHFGVEE